ncbi:MAG: leucine-rich repeat protein, partial [Bacillota bacterium]|nr:leucine-rich repeat protein [Bacillota bacterium]
MKKLVSIFLSLVLIILQIDVVTAFADTTSGDYKYSVSGSNATITGYTGSGKNITIPNKIDGYTVTSIGKDAFYNCNSLTGITIPSSVTSIGDSAFIWCSSLTSITIPSSVTSIGSSAFARCYDLTGITIPSSVTSIGDGAFDMCGSLTSVTIPSSVTSIGNDAFWNCTKLITIDVNAQNAVYSSLDGVLYNKLKTTLITYPNGKINSTFVIPSSVTSIGDYGFAYSFNLTSITIPSSVTSIGNDAFCNCNSLISITIPSSVTSIGEEAFCLCNSLTSITIPSNVTSIGEAAFENCSSLTSITIPSSVTSIGDYTFWKCSSLTSIIIPISVTSIGKDVFYDCPSNLVIYYHNTAIGFTNPWRGFKTVACNIVSYNGNGNTAGLVPVDNNIYTQGTKATILKNTGNLVRTGYTFAGWNTAANGSGTSYPAGSIVSMNGADITLYAQWIAISQSISPSSGTFIKTAPADLTAVITAPNKVANPIIGVYNGTTKLVAGANESVVPTSTGYTLTLYKSYLSKLTVNTPITIKFKDGSTLTYTVVLGATIS